MPLGAFNIGVEAGQIAVAIAVWPLIPRLRAEPLARFRLARACSLLVVAGGAYWLVERILTLNPSRLTITMSAKLTKLTKKDR